MTTPTDTTPNASAPAWNRLRIWPLLVLLAILVAAKAAPYFTSELSPVFFMIAVFGPMAIAAAMALWWLFASRATAKERWLGLLAFVAVVGASVILADKSFQSMAYAFYSLPAGLAVCGLGLLILSRARPPIRGLSVLLAMLAGFGFWDLVRLDGLSGNFAPDMRWRWEPTQEDRFLDGLAPTNPVPAGEANATASVEPLGEADWPQFRGPRRDGTAPGIALESDWEAHPPKEVWKRKLGPGWSSFSVAGNRIFTQEQRGEAELVVCYDARTGEELWKHESTARFWETVGGAGPRATPTLSGGRLYALGATGLLQCLDPLTGQGYWQRDLKVDANREPPIWGFSSSPLVVGDLVIVHAGGKDDKGMLAYDAKTGEPRWSVAAGDDSYSSPQLLNVAGRDAVLMLTNAGLVAVDPASGKEAWRHDWLSQGYRVLQPLVLDGGSVLLGTGMGTGTRRIDLVEGGVDQASGAAEDSDEDGSSPSPGPQAPRIEVRWTSLELKPDFNDYVVHKGHLYGFDHNIFLCVDPKTGKRNWKKGRYGNGQVLLLPDADQLLVVTETGEIVLLRTNPDELEELARHKAVEGKTWNHPALSGNRLFVRNGEEAACLELPLAGHSPRSPSGTQGPTAPSASEP